MTATINKIALKTGIGAFIITGVALLGVALTSGEPQRNIAEVGKTTAVLAGCITAAAIATKE